jgi:multiple antibiotic resistance protein
MHDWHAYAMIVWSLLAIANPLGVIPLFIDLTREQSVQGRHQTARVTAATVAVVLITGVLLGHPLLAVFGISIASLRIGGGVLLLLMAIAMLQAQPSRARCSTEEAEEAAEKDSVAVVPLAVPLVAGPGAISTVMIYAQQATRWFDAVFLVLTSLMVAAVVWGCLQLAEPMSRALGKTGMNIVTRLMGLILAAVAVEFIIGGIVILLPGLAAVR